MTEHPDGRAEGPRTVLVVDDDPASVATVGLNLRRSGYRVLSAGSGESAVELAKTLRPDIILMDYLMPGIDGYEAIRRLRRAPETSRIPVLVLSEVPRDCLPPARMLHAAEEHLIKPVRSDLLLERVARHIGKPRA